MTGKYDRLATTKRSAKKSDEMTTLRTLVLYWLDLCAVDIEWLPVDVLRPHEQKEASMIDWGHRYIVNGHRISEFYLISLINAWMLVQGYGYRYMEIGIFLREWAIARFPEMVPADQRETLAQRVRIVAKRNRGRPRRDGTAVTVIIERVDDELDGGGRRSRKGGKTAEPVVPAPVVDDGLMPPKRKGRGPNKPKDAATVD